MLSSQILRAIFFALALLFLSLVGCDSGGGGDNFISLGGSGLPTPIVNAIPVIPDSGGAGGGGAGGGGAGGGGAGGGGGGGMTTTLYATALTIGTVIDEVNNSNPADLYTIDPATATATLVGSTGLDGLSAIAFANGILYAIASDGTDASLYTLNTASGLPTLVAVVSETNGACARISGMTFDTSTSTMYVFLEGCAVDGLATIDLTTAVITYIANDNDYGDIAHQASSNTLFALNDSGIEVWDRATGLDITSVPFTGSLNNPSAADVHPLTNEVYAVGFVDGLFTVDTTTGATTLIGDPGISFIDGLAFER